jgi:hypoxanthine phosphoribosyltransferase
MANIGLFELFSAEYRDLIQRYQLQLSHIFKDYDIIVFMARKAVCFYKALVIGEFVAKPSTCEVYSNRVLTYNVAKKFRGKKVVVIDDVMIKGKSLEKALKMIAGFGIKADVYIMVRPQLKENDVDILAETNVIGTYAEISEHDIYQLSKHIADFIAASVCPYNIDQPIYKFKNFSKEIVNDFAEDHMLIDISSSLQRKYGIKSFVLEILNGSYKSPVLQGKIELCKIRFLYGRYGDTLVFLAIPFVLLKEMSYAELTSAFDCLSSEQLHAYIFNKKEKLFRENQLKILHYILSARLMDAFISVCGIKTVRRLNNNDDFVFAEDVFQLSDVSLNSFDLVSMPINNEICYNHDFIQNDYLDLSYGFLQSENMCRDHYLNSDCEIIKSELLVLSELKQYITSRTNKELNTIVFSNVIDILIDRGFIIPSVVHGRNETIVRAYKCGEVYALSSKHFSLFAYALKKYLKGIGHKYLFKTEYANALWISIQGKRTH